MQTTDSAPPDIRAPRPRLAAWVPWTLFLLWCIGITVLSSIPGDRFGQSPFSFADKLVHFALFGTGAFFLSLGLRCSTDWSWKRILFLSLGAMLALGVLDELHQLLTPGRSGGDVDDMIADALGGAFGIAFARLLHGRHRPTTNRGTPRPDSAS